MLRLWESKTDNLVLTTELKRKLTTLKSLKTDVSSASHSSERLQTSYQKEV